MVTTVLVTAVLVTAMQVTVKPSMVAECQLGSQGVDAPMLVDKCSNSS